MTDPIALMNDPAILQALMREVENLKAQNAMMAERLKTKPRGKRPPKVGDSRSYKVQENKSGAVSFSLPVSTLGVSINDKVAVSFKDGIIEVRKAVKNG